MSLAIRKAAETLPFLFLAEISSASVALAKNGLDRYPDNLSVSCED
jgi:hypothetical protein